MPAQGKVCRIPANTQGISFLISVFFFRSEKYGLLFSLALHTRCRKRI